MGSNAVASKLFINVEAMCHSVFINYLADLAESRAWLYQVYAFVHRFSCDLTEPLNIRVHFYIVSLQHDHCGIVTVHVLLEAHNIDIEIVASLQHVTVWDAVTDAIVYCEAH